jgi:nitrogen fixation protein FixH
MKRGSWWPIAVTAVLATTVAANVWVATIANDDPSFAIEQDYYKKAITWDSTLAQSRTNATLGWHLTPTLGPIGAEGRARLRATLTDSAGAPISDATVRVSALQVSRANDIQQVTLAAAAGGVYEAQLDARLRGQWELRFDVTAGSIHFTDVARLEARFAP